MFWYSHLQCSVRWNDELGESFSILRVRQGGVLSPFLYAIYVDDLDELRLELWLVMP